MVLCNKICLIRVCNYLLHCQCHHIKTLIAFFLFYPSLPFLNRLQSFLLFVSFTQESFYCQSHCTSPPSSPQKQPGNCYINPTPSPRFSVHCHVMLVDWKKQTDRHRHLCLTHPVVLQHDITRSNLVLVKWRQSKARFPVFSNMHLTCCDNKIC